MEDPRVFTLEERVGWIIVLYLEAVKKSVSEFLADYSHEDDPPELDPVYGMLEACQKGIVPVSGVLNSGRSFTFLENGFRFEYDGQRFEVEFTPMECCDGFDARLLAMFAEDGMGLTNFSQAYIQKGLDGLEQQGYIEMREDCPLYAVRYQSLVDLLSL